MKNLINLLFPPVCLSCNSRIFSKTDSFCKECRKELSMFLDEGICSVCGAKMKGKSCNVCLNSNFLFDKARSVFMINKVVRNLIHNYKYKDLPKIGKLLSTFAVNYIKKNRVFLDTDIVIPVPLHRVKKRIRGFNQAEIIAKEIAKSFNWKNSDKIVLRNKFTETQTKLSKSEREKNVENAFKINHRFNIENKNIMIVDDVFTTGSTVNSISKVLKMHNSGKIYVFTIARAG